MTWGQLERGPRSPTPGSGQRKHRFCPEASGPSPRAHGARDSTCHLMAPRGVFLPHRRQNPRLLRPDRRVTLVRIPNTMCLTVSSGSYPPHWLLPHCQSQLCKGQPPFQWSRPQTLGHPDADVLSCTCILPSVTPMRPSAEVDPDPVHPHRVPPALTEMPPKAFRLASLSLPALSGYSQTRAIH